VIGSGDGKIELFSDEFNFVIESYVEVAVAIHIAVFLA
jgi:hypothetical protein